MEIFLIIFNHAKRLCSVSVVESYAQEFVHNVLPNGVLSLEKISAISEKIRLKEEPEPLKDLSDHSILEFERPAGAEGLRLGLNQANDLGWE